MPIPAILLAAGGAALTGAAFEAGGFGLGRLFDSITGTSDAEATMNQALAQAAFEATVGQQPVALADPQGPAFSAASFFAGRLQQAEGQARALTEASGASNALLSLLGPRADEIAAISIQPRPHPIELLAGARSFHG